MYLSVPQGLVKFSRTEFQQNIQNSLWKTEEKIVTLCEQTSTLDRKLESIDKSSVKVYHINFEENLPNR
jgi:chaperonin cofactor prefoldin